jgi:hypothetical protein
MSGWWVPIVVALIGGPLMWLLHRLEKKNSQQHGESLGILREVREDVKKMGHRLNDHIDWHAHKEP